MGRIAQGRSLFSTAPRAATVRQTLRLGARANAKRQRRRAALAFAGAFAVAIVLAVLISALLLPAEAQAETQAQTDPQTQTPSQPQTSSPTSAAPTCRQDTATLRGPFGTARFTVELATTEADRARGLMHRDHLASSAGMLFVYPADTHAVFWMKNTRIPLDLIFLDAQGVVKTVHSDAVPHDLSPIDGGRGIRAVLEINGGLAKAMGIAAGAQMRHPAFAKTRANWPCE